MITVYYQDCWINFEAKPFQNIRVFRIIPTSASYEVRAILVYC